ncbi:25332_t:CDS:2 [Dentiscutata erythropus]|uniref:25332_t:CDS:1 n=1 Tax=Dentiscutata erythropus TaxID=1348616 RepID=A0A9N9BNK6_9GLOM|nr:25332_t:CDS:2 [Dentiscutata erythropus]
MEETTSASSSSHGTMFLNFINGNYECVNSNEDDYLLDNDNTSFISESLASEKFSTESTTNDCEIEMRPFIWDKLSYEKAHIMANANIGENDEITWEDIEAENEIDTSVLETELPESTEGIEGNKCANKNIFGTSAFTDNMLANFEQTLRNLLETRLNNWDENDFLHTIANLKELIPIVNDSNNKKKRVKNMGPEDSSEIHLNKRQRRQTNENEKKILKSILNSDIFSEDKAFEILNQLLDCGEEGWTLQRIRRYWIKNVNTIESLKPPITRNSVKSDNLPVTIIFHTGINVIWMF